MKKRGVYIKIRVTNLEAKAWKKAAEVDHEGNVSRYVRDTMNDKSDMVIAKAGA